MTRRTTATVAALAAALSLAAPAVAQDKKIIFTGPTPPAEVTIDPAQPVRIGIDGNVTARCRLDANGRCVQTGFGSGGIGPTVSLAADQFSNPPDAQQRYPAGTTFRITPTVGATGEVCARFLQPATLTGTNWTGLIVAPFAASTVTLPAANTTYSFGLRCFADGGATNSALLTYSTSDAAPPPTGDQCNPATLAAVEASRPGFEDAVMTPQNSNFNGVPVPGIPGPAIAPSLFTELVGQAGNPPQRCADFPFVGTNQCKIHAGRNQFISIRFTVPTNGQFPPGKVFAFLESQEADATPRAWYVSFSQCAGDFRVPTSGTAPAGDPTFSYGCRNILGPTAASFTQTLSYRVNGASDGAACGLVPGQVYYLNYINANPVDGGGITQGEYTCPPSTEQSQGGPGYCGVQFRTN